MATKNKRLPVVKRPATTVSGVLRQTHDLLEQEGRWAKGAWFKSKGKRIDPEKPMCSQGWAACSDGMLQAVIYGLPVVQHHDGTCTVWDASVAYGTKSQDALYRKAYNLLADITTLSTNGMHGSIISLNDSTKRSEVLKVFRKAYRRAQYLERIKRAGIARVDGKKVGSLV